jgi:hypothetical protein
MPHHTPKLRRPQGLLAYLVERARGREQRLVRAVGEVPLLLLSYPRGHHEAAKELERAWLHTLPALPEESAGPYRAMLRLLPTIVVVVMHRENVCGCLGHHHPAGTEGRLTRRLAAELGSTVGEIDLAFEGIRRWEPNPLAALASGATEALRFHAGLLSVMLHELEHLAYPDHTEREVRGTSDTFYGAVMQYLVHGETGMEYGIRS